MKDDKELCQWLRDNSSGCYRTSAEAAFRIEEKNNQISELNDNAIEQRMEIITLKTHIKDSRELTDKDLIASLRHDLNVRDQQLLKAGRENKTLADRNEYLEADHGKAR